MGLLMLLSIPHLGVSSSVLRKRYPYRPGGELMVFPDGGVPL